MMEAGKNSVIYMAIIQDKIRQTIYSVKDGNGNDATRFHCI